MLARKFDVGQSVYLRPNLSARNAAFGVYEDQGDATGRGWGVSVSNQESNRVARARRKRERIEPGVTHRDFALVSAAN